MRNELFTLSAVIATSLLSVTDVRAEVWSCKREGSQAAMFTETPTNEPGVTCTPVESITFSKSESKASSSGSKSRASKSRQNSGNRKLVLAKKAKGPKAKGLNGKKKKKGGLRSGSLGSFTAKKSKKKKKK